MITKLLATGLAITAILAATAEQAECDVMGDTYAISATMFSNDGGGIFTVFPDSLTFDGTTKIVGNSFWGNAGDQFVITESQTVVGDTFTVTITLTTQDAAGNLTTWAAPGTTFDNDGDPNTAQVPFDLALFNIGNDGVDTLDVNVDGGTYAFDVVNSEAFVVNAEGATFSLGADEVSATGPSGAFDPLVGYLAEPDIAEPFAALDNEAFAGLGFTFTYTITAPDPNELIVNGSFEEGDFVGGEFRRLAPGDTELTGWTIGGVAVDWHNAVSFTSPNSGDKVLDLHLDGAAGTQGTISQSFATVPGERYELVFFLAGPGSNLNFPNPRAVNVNIAGLQRTFSTPASLNTDLQWEMHRLLFDATDLVTTLQFSSPHDGAGFWGPVLDDVSVTTSLVPEGDLNQDGAVNMSDIALFILVLFTGDYLAEADFNGDGAVNFFDIPAFIALLSP